MAHVDSKQPLRKDTIYIDVEDDITSVIDKVKSSESKIVALVPPKGNPVLQSTVNLKLLNRAANNSDKQAVLVTNNSALMALAGGLGMYVAKNLQSKPYIPSENPGEQDDAIDVNESVGAAAAGAAVGSSVALGDKSDELEVDADELAADLDKDGELKADASVPDDAKEPAKGSKKGGKKVPNFNSFRKKLLLFGTLGIVLVIGLVYLLFKSKTDIVIRAETTPVDVSYQANITDSGTSNPENNVFRGVVQSDNQTATQDFTPTGKKNVGQTATGTVVFSTDSISALGTIPAGTELTSANSLVFTTDSSVTLTAGNALTGVSTSVTAAGRGAKYNGESGSLSGAPNGVSANFDGSSSGGTDKNVTVVTQADIDKATEQLKKQDNSDEKSSLEDGFTDDVDVLSDSFSTNVSSVVSEPAVGKEANQATLSAQVTYSMLAIKKEDLKAANEAAITDEMDDKDQQQVYDDGLEDIQFEKVKLSGTTATYKVKATGQYGPKFDTEQLAQEVSGKKVGEVRSYIQSLPGVKSTDISISPFWASKTPAADRITIKLEVDKTAAAQ